MSMNLSELIDGETGTSARREDSHTYQQQRDLLRFIESNVVREHIDYADKAKLAKLYHILRE